MATGQGGYYTNGLTIGANTDIDGSGLVAVDTQNANGTAPQTLAFTTDQIKAGSFQTLAAAGASQGNAAVISKARVFVTVTASTQGVKLPTAVAGAQVQINAPATVGVKVYPFLADKFSGVATNTAVVLASGKANIYSAIDALTWRVMKGG